MPSTVYARSRYFKMPPGMSNVTGSGAAYSQAIS